MFPPQAHGEKIKVPMFSQKNLKIFFGAAILLMMITIPLNWMIGGKLAFDKGKTPRTQLQESPLNKDHGISREIVVDPAVKGEFAQNGIIVQSQAELPRGQMEWELFMKKTLSPSKNDEDSGSEKDFKNKMRDLSSRIKYYESLRNKRPGDREIEEKLSRLYQLKATLEAVGAK